MSNLCHVTLLTELSQLLTIKIYVTLSLSLSVMVNHRTKESYLGVRKSIILKYVLDKYKTNLLTGLESQVGHFRCVCAFRAVCKNC
jgi:hypothetical protein